MAADRGPTLGELSEGDVLARVLARLTGGGVGGSETLVGPGDDSAVLQAPDGRFVVTTDMMMHGPDFRLAWSSPEDLGWKAAASNLADVAEMVPGCGVVGGDLSASATLTLSITAFGSLDGRPPVLRSGAKPGDVLATAGPLGRKISSQGFADNGRHGVTSNRPLASSSMQLTSCAGGQPCRRRLSP